MWDLIMQFCPPSCYLLRLRTNYFPRYPFLQTPLICVLSLMRKTSFRTHTELHHTQSPASNKSQVNFIFLYFNLKFLDRCREDGLFRTEW